MQEQWSSGRMWRLCQKELRETLRDRRTMITLVLMPLLVYPLLSAALQRFLLTSFGSGSADAPAYWIGTTSTEEGERILQAIKDGQELLQQRPYQPIKIHRRVDDSSDDDAGTPKVVGADRDVPKFEVKIVTGDPLYVLEERAIDLLASASPLPPMRAGSGPIAPYRFRVNYRQGDPQSEAALEQLQKLFQVTNDYEDGRIAKSRGEEYRGVIEMIGEPTISKKSLTSSLTTVIPLVLLLMTITGAVYPAIDLTAGERERGTMEALIASPIPRFALLLSKYVAVITVAMLTAIANLGSMWLTLNLTGVGKILLGEQGFSPIAMLQILPLLLIFACFFSAILLALCSFAKSFKEAQAYLIPVMLVSLAPGVLSLMPGIEFTPMLGIVPLVNMVLLARDIMTGNVEIVPAFAAILSTMVYAAAVLSIAAKLFGMDATMQSGQGSWSDLWRAPLQPRDYPDIGQLFIYLAIFYPIYFMLTNALAQIPDLTMLQRIGLNALATAILFLAMPLLFARLRRLSVPKTFRLGIANVRWWLVVPAVGVLGTSLWMGAHELFLLSKWLHLSMLTEEQMSKMAGAKAELQSIPLPMIIFTMAVVPALAEEFFFRGFVLSSLQRYSAWRQIIFSGLLFGFFHVLSGNTMALERFLPTTFLGLVLGWVAWRTGSLWPGIFLHAFHNGLMYTMAHYEEWLIEHQWGVQEEWHLPANWLAFGACMIVLGGIGIYASRKAQVPSEEPSPPPISPAMN